MRDLVELFVTLFLVVAVVLGITFPIIYFTNAMACKEYNRITKNELTKTQYFFTNKHLKIVDINK